MLRLCYDLNRYSADIDLWLVREVDEIIFADELKSAFGKEFEITDSAVKRNTLLIEIRSADYPKRLKIEIRRELKKWDTEKKIAWSRWSSRQVLLRVHSLRQTMLNKIEALLGRGEIRDAFDIEFLLRRGIKVPDMPREKKDAIIKRINQFTANDYKVKLGSLLEKEMREYYNANGFEYLLSELNRVKFP
jgi:hypothetical protein